MNHQRVPTRPLTGSAARRWTAWTAPLQVARLALIASWVGAMAVALITDTDRCRPADPSFCGPDQSFAWWSVVLFLTPLLLLWRPLAGCVAGVVFGAADQVFDDLRAANVAFGVHAAMCLVVAVLLVRAARRQRLTVEDMTGSATATAVTSVRSEPVDPGWDPAATVLAVLAVVVGTALLGWYDNQVTTERTHLARAVTVSAVVESTDEDASTVTLTLPDGRSVSVSPLDTYGVSAGVPLLVDPTDPGWTRLVAEPADHTGWESAGLFSLARPARVR